MRAMNKNASGHSNHPDDVYFLSEMLGAKVMLHGKKIGRLTDMVIVEEEKLPYVTHICVKRPFGYPSLLIPWEKVESVTAREIIMDVEEIEKYAGEPQENAVLLRDHILDKKVLDIEDRDVDVVYDVKMVLRKGWLYVTDVDFSRYGLFKRMGLKGIANFIYSLADKIDNDTVSWAYVQRLPTNISSFRGDVKLKVLKEKLDDLNPVDLADVIEEMEHEQRVEIFSDMDTERASDTLEEIDPSVQRALVSSLGKEKVAELIDEMTPGQAADVLSVLPWEDAKAILELTDKEDAAKIESILEKGEENIINYASSNFIKVYPSVSVLDAQEEYPHIAKGKEAIMYLYVVDNDDQLLGVVDIKDLLKEKDHLLLGEIMDDVIVSLKPETTLREAAVLFDRYDFRALPVVNPNGRIVGVVPYRDVMKLTHHFTE
jgi:CBS domain-containing protein/sporulation protein YlmC with PRC-barrel domain